MDTQTNNAPAPALDAGLQASLIAGCADMLGLLSCLMSYPTTDVAAGLTDSSIAQDVHQIAAELGMDPECADPGALRAYEGGSPEDVLESIRISYTAMFTHPQEPLLAITEMRFRDIANKVDTPSTAFLNLAALHAEQCYRHAGFALSTAQSREPGDHMAAELEFASRLYTRLYVAIVHEDADEAAKQKELIGEFRPHLDAWAASFFDACAQHAEHPLYAWTGTVGREFFRLYADFPEL